MVLNKYLLAGLFALNTLCLAGGVAAAVAPTPTHTEPQGPVVTETNNDARQDRKNEAEQARQDATIVSENDKQDVRAAANEEAIKDLTGDQTFILQLVGIFMPLLSLLATGMIAYFQYKARAERHAMAVESRENLGHMGRSINGMKSELVAAVKAAAFAEGATHALATKDSLNLESIEKLRERAAQLAREAEEASKKAAQLADEAVRKIEAAPPNSP